MAISKTLTKYLVQKNYKYEIIEHKTTYTAWDTARTTQKKEKKVKPEEIVKTLVMKADKEYLLALVSANRRLDKKKLLKAVNADRKKSRLALFKRLDFAKEAWMKKNILGRVGATPPFRELLGLDVYLDNAVVKQKNIYVGSGEYEFSIKIALKQYLKNEQPLTAALSAKK